MNNSENKNWIAPFGILIIFLLLIFNLKGQIHTIKDFDTGTLINYYIGECGNTIPQSSGKISFCDPGGNLGVVESSLGLNSNYIHQMGDNFYNNDRLFITKEGISIQKEDGSWDNVPNRSAPVNFGPPGELDVLIRDATYLPDGRIVFFGTNIGPQIDIYNPTTKELSAIPVDSNSIGEYPIAIEYDFDNDLLWILTHYTNPKLYRMENDSISFEKDLDFSQFSNNYEKNSISYYDDNLYLIQNNGLVKIELGNGYQETFYDNSITGLLPFDDIYDMEFDSEGKLWLAQFQTSPANGGLTCFDPLSETYELYQLQDDTGPFNVRFRSIGIDADGHVWSTTNDYSGNHKLSINGSDTIWEHYSINSYDTLGLSYIYNVNFIHTQNGDTFFCTRSNGSNSLQTEHEALIWDGTNWSGINDNDEGNISHRMTHLTHEKLFSDTAGGIWWTSGSNSDYFFYLNNENNLEFYHHDSISYTTAHSINSSGQFSIKINSEFGQFENGMLNSFEPLPFNGSGFSYSKSVGSAIWVCRISGSDAYLVEYVDGLINNIFVIPDMSQYYQFDVLSNGKIAFSKTWAGILTVRTFNPSSQELEEFGPFSINGTFRELIAGNSGDLWLIYSRSLLHFENDYSNPTVLDESNTIMSALNSGSGHGSLQDAVLDTAMNLHVIQGSGKIYTFEPPYMDSIVDVIQITGNTGLLPMFSGWTPGWRMISLDSEGDMWTASAQNTIFELKDSTFIPEYHLNFDVITSLPIDLLYFQAEAKEDRVLLEWSTLSEVNNDYFEILRSEDGIVWKTIETIEGAGNSSEMLSYTSFDYNPLQGKSYYILRQTDFDGTTSYSDVRFVHFELDASDILIYPNPSKDFISIELPEKLAPIHLEVYSSLGIVVASFNFYGRKERIDLSEFASGIYTLKFIIDDKEVNKKIIKL